MASRPQTASPPSCGRPMPPAATRCAERRHSDFQRITRQHTQETDFRLVVTTLRTAARRTDGRCRRLSSVFPPARPQHGHPCATGFCRFLGIRRNVVWCTDYRRCRLAAPSQPAAPDHHQPLDHCGADAGRPDRLVSWTLCPPPGTPARIALASSPATISASAAIAWNIAVHTAASIRRKHA